MSLRIRGEQPSHEKAIFEVNFRASGRDTESKVIGALRTNCPQAISLVGEEDGAIVGHILFAAVWIESSAGKIEGMGLGLQAVVP
jgi:putative acetyltransferase